MNKKVLIGIIVVAIFIVGVILGVVLSTSNNDGIITTTTTTTTTSKPACKHDDPTQIVVVEAVAPTCQETGLTEGMKCNLCGTMVVPQALVDATGCCEYSLRDDGTYIVMGIISGCNCTAIIVPETYQGIAVTAINRWAFEECTTFTSITIGDNVTFIGQQAFVACKSLASVTIGKNVTNIEGRVFYGCTSLTSIKFEGTVAQWNSINIRSPFTLDVDVTEIVCSDGVVTLD